MKGFCSIYLMVLGLLPLRLQGQPLFSHATSLDSMMMNSDRVVVGTIVEFNPEQGRNAPTRRVTIEVSRTFKGSHSPRLSIQLGDYTELPTAWKQNASKLLVAVQEDPPGESIAINLDDPKLEVMTADVTVLRTRQEVLDAAIAMIRRSPGVRRIEQFNLPVRSEVIQGTGWEKYYQTGGYLTLVIPVDERLEKRAIEGIASDDYSRRQEAITALRYFRSDQNVERARALLSDDKWAYLGGTAQENMGIETHLYGVREAAYQTLRYWGIDVKEPITQETVTRLDLVTLVDYSNQRLTGAMLNNLGRFPNLNMIMLQNTALTDSDLMILAEFKSLRELYLGGTRVTDGGMKVLASLPQLEYVGLQVTRVTDAGIAELRKAHPDVRIDR